MRKKFVLDTNILLTDPNAIFTFADNDVYIPICVIEELDNFKKSLSETGRNARHVSRILDDLRQKNALSSGVPLVGDGLPASCKEGRLYVILEADMSLLPNYFERKPDHLILSVTLDLQKKYPHNPVVLITKDSNLRIKGDALGMRVEDFQADKIDIDDLYSQVVRTEVDSDLLQDYVSDGLIICDALTGLTNLRPNQYVILQHKEDPLQFAYGRYNCLSQSIEALNFGGKDVVWGIYPKNLEQHFALDLLLDDEIKLVTLVGSAGTGKTLLAIAAGLEKTTGSMGPYQKMLVSRPIFPLGRDVGFLPGNLEEKLNPWMQPIFDNLEFLLNRPSYGRSKRALQTYQELMEQGLLEVEAITYIRGRSLPNQYFIVDEAQNLTPHEIKTILTRAGENTKIVLTGDPQQIDNPYVDAASNGLTYVIERMKNERIAGHVTLLKGERSLLASLAATLL